MERLFIANGANDSNDSNKIFIKRILIRAIRFIRVIRDQIRYLQRDNPGSFVFS